MGMSREEAVRELTRRVAATYVKPAFFPVREAYIEHWENRVGCCALAAGYVYDHPVPPNDYGNESLIFDWAKAELGLTEDFLRGFVSGFDGDGKTAWDRRPQDFRDGYELGRELGDKYVAGGGTCS